jgi:hypothetical protein
MTPTTKTIINFRHFHPLAEVDLPFVINNFHPNTNIFLDKEAFIFALAHSPHFSFGDPLSIVYEFLRNYFFPNDSTNGFDIFLKICKHIIHDHVLPLV